MKSKILSLAVLYFLVFSTISYSHDPEKTKDPLSFYQGKVGELYCTRYAFNAKTLMDIVQNDNPLGLENWGAYYLTLTNVSRIALSLGAKESEMGGFGGGSYLHRSELCFKTKAGRTGFIDHVKSWLSSSKLEPYADFDKLGDGDAERFTSSYEILQDLMRTLEPDTHAELKSALFPHSVEQILSCADGCSNRRPEANQYFSTAFKLVHSLKQMRKKMKRITAGDLSWNAEECSIEYNNQSIQMMRLDNLKGFREQFKDQPSYQLVIGMSLLCCCAGSSSSSCGGLTLGNASHSVSSFLNSVESVMDSEYPASRAILHGINPIESPEWKTEVERFNQKSSKYQAEIIRDTFGEFAGIILFRR